MCKIHVQRGCFVLFCQQQDCRLVVVVIIRQESLVDLNHVIDILHLLGNEIHDWRFVCCRRQWRSVLGKRRRNAAISNEKELVNLIS
jgi:hypothetical protein